MRRRDACTDGAKLREQHTAVLECLDAVLARLDTMTAENAAMRAQIDTLTAENAALSARLDGVLAERAAWRAGLVDGRRRSKQGQSPARLSDTHRNIKLTCVRRLH